MKHAASTRNTTYTMSIRARVTRGSVRAHRSRLISRYEREQRCHTTRHDERGVEDRRRDAALTTELAEVELVPAVVARCRDAHRESGRHDGEQQQHEPGRGDMCGEVNAV